MTFLPTPSTPMWYLVTLWLTPLMCHVLFEWALNVINDNVIIHSTWPICLRPHVPPQNTSKNLVIKILITPIPPQKNLKMTVQLGMRMTGWNTSLSANLDKDPAKKLRYSQTWANLWITATCLQRPSFERPNFNLYKICYLWTTTTFQQTPQF